MSQTDRQTDKASNWNSAVFDVDDNWAKLDTLPPFVKVVHKQKEICPTTNNPHFQVHVVCHRQVRLSQMCSWIKKTNWKPVKGDTYIKNSIAYTSKQESAVPGTHTVTQGEKYLQIHELLLEIAKHYRLPEMADGTGSMMERAIAWETVTGRMITQDPKWANKLSTPALKKAWDWWGYEFVNKVSEYSEETGGAYIVEGPASEESSPGSEEECLIE